MIFKTGEVAIYAASLRFCPIVKFSLYEAKVIWNAGEGHWSMILPKRGEKG